MSNIAQRLASEGPRQEPAAEIDETWRSSSKAAADMPSPANKIVSLFADLDVQSETPPDDGAEAIDWLSAIEHIRDVGARVRLAHDVAREVSCRSQSMVRRSLKQTEDAERRVEAAEAAAVAALARADKAEELARLSEARAQLAENQAATAKAAEAEARLWLKRIHVCLKNEFKYLKTDLT